MLELRRTTDVGCPLRLQHCDNEEQTSAGFRDGLLREKFSRQAVDTFRRDDSIPPPLTGTERQVNEFTTLRTKVFTDVCSRHPVTLRAL